MSESGTTGSIETFKVQLPAGALREDFDPKLFDAIERFEPLPFDASRDALRWLREHVAAPQSPEFPLLTVLDLDPSYELMGFCVLGYLPVRFMPGAGASDFALDVPWIARSAKTENGFGEGLFDYAVSIGLDRGATAMVVTPHDEETARKIWIERFHFRPAPLDDQPEDAPPRLWYPIREPRGF